MKLIFGFVFIAAVLGTRAQLLKRAQLGEGLDYGVLQSDYDAMLDELSSNNARAIEQKAKEEPKDMENWNNDYQVEDNRPAKEEQLKEEDEAVEENQADEYGDYDARHDLGFYDEQNRPDDNGDVGEQIMEGVQEPELRDDLEEIDDLKGSNNDLPPIEEVNADFVEIQGLDENGAESDLNELVNESDSEEDDDDEFDQNEPKHDNDTKPAEIDEFENQNEETNPKQEDVNSEVDEAVEQDQDTFDVKLASEEVKEPVNEQNPEEIDSDEYKDIPYDDVNDDVNENTNNNSEDKFIADLNLKLKDLFDTMDKLDSSEEDQDVQNYELEFGKPFREDNILQLRQQLEDDYESINDSNLDKIFADNDEVKADDGELPFIDGKVFNEELIDNNDDIPKELNENLESVNDNGNILEELNENLDSINDNAEILPIEEIANDAANEEEEEKEPAIETLIAAVKSEETQSDPEEIKPEAEQLSYSEQMKEFREDNADKFNVNSESFVRNIAPVHMQLSVDEKVVITSPNYPANYPTNNIVDWILEGEGRGIELNITDLNVRGVANDYLLIIPGGLDASWSDGLVFSYHLDEPRLYRFLNVDRVFVRFESGSGLLGLTGWSMSVKLILPPLVEEEEEKLPEPELLAPEPNNTFTVILAGLSPDAFIKIEEEFRKLIANMATMYINREHIDMGVNTTDEVTQITRINLCSISWPGAEQCTEVTFGVPLLYGDEQLDGEMLGVEDLERMWNEYAGQDPFALRLRQLGVTEFSGPNEARVLLWWLVAGGGALAAALLLALALWRYSCFQDYTRMGSYSSSSSLYDGKKVPELFPTPHQTMPRLSGTEYRWTGPDGATRVDMDGFNNKSYVSDLYDVESDDDVIAPRDRYTTDV